MTDHPPAAGGPGDEPDNEADVLDETREAAMMRAVMRTQEKHREGGIDRELEEPGTDPGPDA
jgi:hypothetical protein